MSTRILVVEDTWENQELMRYLLKAHGYEVLVASDGAEAVTIARREIPDLLLCDVQLPDMDGYEVLRRLRGESTLAHVPIVAVSALSSTDDRRRLAEAGFDGFLPKPIAPETFVGEALGHLNSRVHLHDRPAACAPPRDAGRCKSILVVDDLQSNLELAEIVLKHLGYGVELAKGTRSALRHLHERRPDLILSDVRMADGDGFELLQQVRSSAALRAVPFILITSFTVAEEERERGIAMGADRFLARPIAPHALRDEIEASIRERLHA